MNLFKSFFLGALTLYSMIFAAQAFAVETTSVQTKSTSTLVSTVNLNEAKIISQDGSTFNISFTISNREGLQAGVKYSVRLMSEDLKYIMDEKVYDESVTLYEHSTIKREVTYTAPSQIGGTYNLFVISNNESNFPFGTYSLGKVKLLATTKGIKILNDSCYLQVEGEKGSPRYTLSQSIDISTSEKLRLTCTAQNEGDTSLTVSPAYETRYFSAYGKIAPQAGGDINPITFLKNEKKSFSLVLPSGDIPQFYNLKVALTNGEVSSNSISMNYIVSGTNATIHKLSLDKDYYNRGDNGEIVLIWSASAGKYKRSSESNSGTPLVSIKINITNENGKECIDPIKQDLVRDFSNPETRIAFKANMGCANPRVSVSITDQEGNILDQKDFTFKSNPETKRKSPILPYVVFLIVILAATLGVNRYIKNKKIPAQ